MHHKMLKLRANQQANKSQLYRHCVFLFLYFRMELQQKLNQGLSSLGLSVERDRELKDKTVIGFFIYIEYLNKIIINALSQAAKG